MKFHITTDRELRELRERRGAAQDAVDRPLEGFSEAQCQAHYQALAQQQQALPRAGLEARHASLIGPRGQFALLVQELETLGRQAPTLVDLVELGSRELRTRADKALSFVFGHQRLRPPAPNPYRGLSRERLCCMVYDEQAGFTLIERYAALVTLRQHDTHYFSRLIDTTRKTVERRLVFRGLLEHFDALLPIERCIYPASYREAQLRHLQQEEQIYGPLELGQPMAVLVARHSISTLLKKAGAIQAPTGNA